MIRIRLLRRFLWLPRLFVHESLIGIVGFGAGVLD